MKIIIENKNDKKDCCVLDTEKAIAIRVEPFEGKIKMITITYEHKLFTYTDDDCNFYTITRTMDGRAHKDKVDMEKILTNFALGLR